MMNVYAEKVKKYLDEEKIQYSSEDVGEQEENLVVYPSFEAGPNIWAEIEADCALHLTAYLEHDVEEERADWLRSRVAGLSGAKNGPRLVVDGADLWMTAKFRFRRKIRAAGLRRINPTHRPTHHCRALILKSSRKLNAIGSHVLRIPGFGSSLSLSLGHSRIGTGVIGPCLVNFNHGSKKGI